MVKSEFIIASGENPIYKKGTDEIDHYHSILFLLAPNGKPLTQLNDLHMRYRLDYNRDVAKLPDPVLLSRAPHTPISKMNLESHFQGNLDETLRR